jgi:hypothetical protein
MKASSETESWSYELLSSLLETDPQNRDSACCKNGVDIIRSEGWIGSLNSIKLIALSRATSLNAHPVQLSECAILDCDMFVFHFEISVLILFLLLI